MTPTPSSSAASTLSARICRLVVGTAGHIDHGKSTLVLKLTGTHPDRLKEEKERGLTTDIGYAHFRLQDGSIVGMVDVPGHERFIKNMVAGATGIDFVLLVVAADDGVMPQTREHLQIMSLLGLERGAVVLTKIDLVEKEFLELVVDDLKGLLLGTFLAEAPIFPISSETGEGIPELREHLERTLPPLQRPVPAGAFRMPIQRVFSARGFGTVVTGVPASGIVQVDDTIELLPAGRLARVRGIQAYGVKSSSAGAGQRAALNLSDVDYKEVARGDTVATPGCFLATGLVEARFRALGPAGRKPLEHMAHVRFHAGTSEVLGRLAILDCKSLGPGEEAFVQIRLDDEKIVVAPGDRFVLRVASPNMTLGGGVVLGESPLKLRRLRPEVIETLRRKDAALADPAATVDAALLAAGGAGAALKDLPRLVGQTEAQVRAHLRTLAAAGRAHFLARESRAIHSDALAAVGVRVLETLAGAHRAQPLRPAIPRSELARSVRVDPEVLSESVARLVSLGSVVEGQGGRLRDASFAVRLSPHQQEVAARIEKAFLTDPFQTPRAEDLPALAAAPAKETEPLLQLLIDQGTVVRLKDGILLHRDAVEKARELVVAHIRERGELISADFKDVVKSTRKYVIPLLEHMDEIGVTKRDGNRRILSGA